MQQTPNGCCSQTDNMGVICSNKMDNGQEGEGERERESVCVCVCVCNQRIRLSRSGPAVTFLLNITLILL